MQNHNSNTQIEEINGIFRVLVGPILTEEELSRLLVVIKDSGYPKAFIRR